MNLRTARCYLKQWDVELTLTPPRRYRRPPRDKRWHEYSIHESGHAVAHLALGDEVVHVWVDPTRPGGVGGECQSVTTTDPLARAVTFVAGGVAELLAGHAARPRYSKTDWSRAIALVGQQRIREVESCAKRLLTKNWNAVRAIAQALVDRGELTGTQVRRIFEECQPARVG